MSNDLKFRLLSLLLFLLLGMFIGQTGGQLLHIRYPDMGVFNFQVATASGLVVVIIYLVNLWDKP